MQAPSTLLCRQWPESRKKLVKHLIVTVTTIEAVFRFLSVFPKMFAAHVDVSAIDCALQLRPETFD